MFDVLYCRVSEMFTIVSYHVHFAFEIETANVTLFVARYSYFISKSAV